MKILSSSSTLFLCVLMLFLGACERPNSPDFKLEHKVHAPVLFEKTFIFLGGNSDALIDTTSSDFDSLFNTNSNGLVTLSKEQNFDVGSIDDAIPEVNTDPAVVNSTVGEVTLTDFSSQNNLGSADFSGVTGLPSSTLSQGDPIPPGSTPGSVNIDLNTNYFVSATISSNGTITIDIFNDLGMDFDNVQVTLRAGSTVIDSDGTGPISDLTSASLTMDISTGTVLSDLNVDVSASWPAQNLQRDPGNLIVDDLQITNLSASQVQAAVASQDFTTTGTVNISNTAFLFTTAEHYIELESGTLLIDQIVNNIDVAVDTLTISFPGIRQAPYSAADSLVIRFEGATRIPRANSFLPVPEKNRDLSDLRIYAENSQLDYYVRGVTENTQTKSDSIRTIHQDDNLLARFEINNLDVRKAFGVVLPREVLVNDDDPTNGAKVLDLYNDLEAEIIEVDELSDISEKLDGIEFSNPLISVNYNSNIGFPSTIYAAIVGSDANGNEIYLTADAGGPNEVTPGEVPASLRSNGTPLGNEQLIKFTVNAAGEGETLSDAVQFDRTTTNTDEFLNNLPINIRFIGVARMNGDSEEGIIIDPVRFDPAMSVDLPLNFSASSASYSDTTEADLSDLPDPEKDDQRLSEASINVRYTNYLPFSVQLNLVMLDSLGQVVTRVPEPGDNPLEIGSAPVGNDQFVDGENQGNLILSLNDEQLNLINRTRKMLIEISFNTTNQNSVKVRASDSISLGVSLKAAVESTIN